jgi:hypothetical protein
VKLIGFTVFLVALFAAIPLPTDERTIQFIDVTQQAGLLEPLDGMMAHAAAWADIDGDDDLDLYVGGFGDRPDAEYQPAQGPVPNRLFRNLSHGRFEQVLHPAVELRGRTTDAAFVDLNNDGMPDLYVANNTRPSTRRSASAQQHAAVRSSAVFQNDRGTFVEVSGAGSHCVTAPGSARSVGVLDYDGDGVLDLLVLEDRFGRRARTRLCRNLGGFTFEDVTRKAGLPVDLFGLDVAIADVNGDRRPDLFVSHSNRLFISTSDGGYMEPSGPKAALTWTPLDSEDWPAGATFADLNRDGLVDLVVGVHHERARNRVYLNDGLQNGVPVFRDVSSAAGLPAQLSTKSPHVEVQDFDNDGWPDLYFSAAWLDADGNVVPLVFRNTGVDRGTPRFAPLRQLSNSPPRVYFPAGPSGDYDGDGRVDLFLANWFRGNHSRLLRNVSREHRWLEVQVRGRRMNRVGIGAKVFVYEAGALNRAEGFLGMQEITSGSGFASGQVPVAHFGLGTVTRVDLMIEFPHGSATAVRDVQANRRIVVDGP